MLKRVLKTYRQFGMKGVVNASYHRFVPRRARCLNETIRLVSMGAGLEVGGPSDVFGAGGELPLYPHIEKLDNCNFSSHTEWEGEISSGETFCYDPHRPSGRQYILEASDLREIQTESYDFVLSSHCLEHLADPILGLHEWIRVLRHDGILVLLLPHKDRTFDHRRPVTTLDHLITDFKAGVGEDDLTHLDEILTLHDIERDAGVDSAEELEQQSRNNYNNRRLHQHVFDNKLVAELLSHVQLQIIALENILPFHIAVVARKIPVGSKPDNSSFVPVSAPSWI